jgi:hypothetical protein
VIALVPLVSALTAAESRGVKIRKQPTDSTHFATANCAGIWIGGSHW